MKTLTVADAVTDFGAVLVSLESDHEEIVIMRGDHAIARLVPEPETMDAAQVFADLHGRLDDDVANEMLRGIEEARNNADISLNQLRNPWDS